ncbi:MAG: phosphosulfolactate synthase [Acidobacteria bacterium]|nr:phosphosulfolactate synthase [Acidobacteriota bacterium]
MQKIGVPQIPPCTSPFDPGYDPVTLASHLEQSSHLMSLLKISMACWQVAKEAATRKKVAAAKRWKVPTVTGGGPFEVAVAQGQLSAYLDLCAGLGFAHRMRRGLYGDAAGGQGRGQDGPRARARCAVRAGQETYRPLHRGKRARADRAGTSLARRRGSATGGRRPRERQGCGTVRR